MSAMCGLPQEAANPEGPPAALWREHAVVLSGEAELAHRNRYILEVQDTDTLRLINGNDDDNDDDDDVVVVVVVVVVIVLQLLVLVMFLMMTIVM